MAKYYLDYTFTRSVSESGVEIVEASSLAEAKRIVKKQLEEDFSGENVKVHWDDTYRTSDDARV